MIILSGRAQYALLRLLKEARWWELQMLDVRLSALKELQRCGLAEHNPTSKGQHRLWRLTVEGERERAVLLRVLAKAEA